MAPRVDSSHGKARSMSRKAKLKAHDAELDDQHSADAEAGSAEDASADVAAAVQQSLQSNLGNTIVQAALNGSDIGPIGEVVAGEISAAVSGVGATGGVGLAAAGNAALARVASRLDTGGEAQMSQSEALNELRGTGGQALPADVQARMEQTFGQSFAGVRVHTDGRSAAATGALGAEAVARGDHLFFADGKYDPGSTQGEAVIRHELTHVVQSREGRLPTTGGVSDKMMAAEREAYAMERDSSVGNEAQEATNEPGTDALSDALHQAAADSYDANRPSSVEASVSAGASGGFDAGSMGSMEGAGFDGLSGAVQTIDSVGSDSAGVSGPTAGPMASGTMASAGFSAPSLGAMPSMGAMGMGLPTLGIGTPMMGGPAMGPAAAPAAAPAMLREDPAKQEAQRKTDREANVEHEIEMGLDSGFRTVHQESQGDLTSNIPKEGTGRREGVFMAPSANGHHSVNEYMDIMKGIGPDGKETRSVSDDHIREPAPHTQQENSGHVHLDQEAHRGASPEGADREEPLPEPDRGTRTERGTQTSSMAKGLSKFGKAAQERPDAPSPVSGLTNEEHFAALDYLTANNGDFKGIMEEMNPEQALGVQQEYVNLLRETAFNQNPGQVLDAAKSIMNADVRNEMLSELRESLPQHRLGEFSDYFSDLD